MKSNRANLFIIVLMKRYRVGKVELQFNQELYFVFKDKVLLRVKWKPGERQNTLGYDN